MNVVNANSVGTGGVFEGFGVSHLTCPHTSYSYNLEHILSSSSVFPKKNQKNLKKSIDTISKILMLIS